MANDAYASPQVVDSFDALEVFGTAEGSEVLVAVGNGSQLPTISIAG
jgi:prefoldin subunit 5